MYLPNYQPSFQNTQQKIYALCLNPYCSCFTRRCSLVYDIHNNDVIDPNHASCKRWLCNLSSQELTLKQGIFQSNQKEDFDFLKQPLSSIDSILTFQEGNWKQGINNIFMSIKNQIIKKIFQVEQKVYHKVQSLLERARKIKNNILELRKNTINIIWGNQHERYYSQVIQKDLTQLQKIGILKVLNYESLSYQIDKIKQIIKKIQCYFWIEESQYDRSQRINLQKIEYQLQELLQYKQISDISLKLQDIHRCLKIKNFSFKDKIQNSKNQQISLNCNMCDAQIYPNNDSRVKNSKEKRSQCIMNLYLHFCRNHREEVLQKYVRKSSKVVVRLNLEQVLREVSSNQFSACVVIDRENFNSSKEYRKTKDVYVLEVVSTNQENIATGRYLLAQSSGKDAADILIILVLYQLSKLDQKMRLILVTNDHYGKTLQPIYKSLGAKIEVANLINSQIITQLANQSVQISMKNVDY